MIIILIIAGLVDGAIISMTMPIFSSAIDNAAVTSGKRKEGLYNGTYIFFSRLGIMVNALVFWIVRTFTGYQSGSTDPAELMGLRLQISIFPMIIMFSGILIFWRLYRLSEEKIKANILKLKELQL